MTMMTRANARTRLPPCLRPRSRSRSLSLSLSLPLPLSPSLPIPLPLPLPLSRSPLALALVAVLSVALGAACGPPPANDPLEPPRASAPKPGVDEPPAAAPGAPQPDPQPEAPQPEDPRPEDPPAAPTGGDRFLVRDGVSSADDAAAYAASLDLAPDTIDDWRAEAFGDAPLIEALYQNTADLGFWRELACTERVDRGVGGCAVRNWAGPEDEAAGAANLGTVAMRMDDEGRVQFYAFGPDGARSDRVILDSEGEKFLPSTCTSCHGGAPAVGDAGGLGSIFRELEPSQLATPPGVTRADLEDTFARFNSTLRAANRRVKSEAEGAPAGADHAARAVVDYIDAMYATGDVALDVDDDAHVPPSWGAPARVEDVLARRDLWTKLVNAHCMGCHRTSDVDLSDYALFTALAGDIDRLLALDHDDGSAVMPQAELSWTNLSEDVEAQAALDRWLASPEHEATAAPQ